METPDIVITEEDDWNHPLKSGLNLIWEKSALNFNKETIIVILDVPFPTGFPAAINRTKLKELLSFLKSHGFVKIFCTLASIPDINYREYYQKLGFETIIKECNALILEDSEYFSLSHSNHDNLSVSSRSNVLNSLKIKYYIVFSQIRLDFDWGFHTSFTTLFNLFKNNPYIQNLLPIITEKTSFSQNRKECIEIVSNFIKKFPPLLVINDCSRIAQTPNYMGLGIVDYQKSNKIFFAENLFQCDLLIFNKWGFSAESGRFTSILPFFHPQFPNKSNNITEKGTLSPFYSIIRPSLSIQQFNLHGLDFFIGELNHEDHNALLHLCFMMEKIMLKDANNLGKWAIIAGINPPIPNVEVKTKYFVFGQNACRPLERA